MIFGIGMYPGATCVDYEGQVHMSYFEVTIVFGKKTLIL